jgi:hypothetical protein
MNEMTYPLGTRGTESSPGTFHSTESVSGGSYPTSTRRRSIARDTLDRIQFDMAAASFRANWRCKRLRCCGRKGAREARCKGGGR